MRVAPKQAFWEGVPDKENEHNHLRKQDTFEWLTVQSYTPLSAGAALLHRSNAVVNVP